MSQRDIPTDSVGALTPHSQCGATDRSLSSVPRGRSKSVGSFWAEVSWRVLLEHGVLRFACSRCAPLRDAIEVHRTSSSSGRVPLTIAYPHTSDFVLDVWGFSTCGGMDLFSVLLAPLRNLPMGEHYRSPLDFFIAGTFCCCLGFPVAADLQPSHRSATCMVPSRARVMKSGMKKSGGLR